MLYLREPFAALWKNKNPFEMVEKIEGEVFRALEARKTLRFFHDGKGYFLKIHRGVGWWEIIDNLLHIRRPVLGAEDEFNAICKLESLGINTMQIVGFGKKGWNIARQQSFIITEELTDTISLEDYCMQWKKSPPAFSLKQALIVKVAGISRMLHQHGVNHRDYYLCHFLLHIPHGRNNIDRHHFTLWLIDLHRAQLRKETPGRWIIKDLAALMFSALDIGLTTRDRYRFIQEYTGLSLRQAFLQYQWLWQPLQKKTQKLAARKEKKGDAV